MVPWHLQPQYSGATPTCNPQPRKKKKVKKKKQLECEHVDNMSGSSDATITCVSRETVSSFDHTHSLNEVCDISDSLIDHTPSLIEITEPIHSVSELITKCADHTPSLVSECTDQTLLNEPKVDHTLSLTEPKVDHTPLLTESNQTSLTETIVEPIVTGCTDHTHIDELHQLGYVTYQRYYHVFCKGELSLLCGRVHCLKLLSSWYDHDNWCVLLEKVE